MMSGDIPPVARARQLALDILPEDSSPNRVRYATMKIAELYQLIDHLEWVQRHQKARTG